MPRVLATFKPRDDEERRIVEEGLGEEVAWLADGGSLGEVEVALSFWPRGELTRRGLGWADFPKLRVLQLCTAGANHVDWSTVPDAVQVGCAPGTTGPYIAEYVLGVTLAWSRRLFYHTQEIKAGRFELGDPIRGLGELTIGLVGYGGIGQATARLMRGLGCRIVAVSRSGVAAAGDREPLDWLGTMADLPRLQAESDVIVLCLPLIRETEGLVDVDFLAPLMGRRVLLVNVARGAVVDEEALHAWLDSSTKHWAALDTWWKYPRKEREYPFTQPFHKLPNVIMTPHNSPNVTGFRYPMIQAAVEHARTYLESGDIAHPVDREAHQLDVDGDGR